MLFAWLSAGFQSPPPLPTSTVGPSGAYSQVNGLGGWFCVQSRTLRVSPTNSSLRLGVCPTATTSTGFFSQRFCGFLSSC